MEKLKLNYIHICDEVVFSQEGKLSLIGIFDVINITNLPGSLPKAYMVCNLSVLDKKLEKVDLDFEVVEKKTNDVVNKIPTLTTNLGKRPEGIENQTNLGITIQLLGLVFKAEGVYSINLTANGERVGSKEFTVKEKKNEGALA